MRKSTIVRQYLDKFKGHKRLNVSSLSRAIYKDHKFLFKDVEDVRDAIRYCTGKKGEKKLKYVKGSGYVRVKDSVYGGIPPEIKPKEKTEDVKICGENTLVIGDLHYPFHDRKAISIAIQYGIDCEADSIILNGDVHDCFSMSTFRKEDSVKLSNEIKMMWKFLDMLRIHFPKKRIYYKIGNHEERLVKYISDKAPELLDLFNPDIGVLDYSKVYKASLFDIDIVGPIQTMKIGKLNIVHGGKEIGKLGGGKNVASKVLSNAVSNMLVHHFHSTSNETIKTYDGTIISTWSVGCLCKLSQGYSLYNPRWTHGFAMVDNRSGGFVVQNKKIIKGHVY